MNARIIHGALALLAASLSLSLSLSQTACRAHVALDEPPPVTAPLADRSAAFERWKPKRLVDPGYRIATPNTPALLLNDGTVIEHPTDLAVLVPPASPTRQHAERARELDETSAWFRLGGAAVGIASVAGMLGSGALFAADDADLANLAFVSSSLLGSVGGLVLGIPAMAMQLEREREALLAFHAYEADLRKRLALERTARERTAKWEDTSTPPSLDPVE